MKSFHHIVITGTSSGIGEALAFDYAAPGIALGLSGRDGARLARVADICRARGATRCRRRRSMRPTALRWPRG